MLRYTLLPLLFCLCIYSCKKETNNTSEQEETLLATDTIISATYSFKGVNWADERDNFVNDWLLPSGLNVSDNESTLLSKADRLIALLQKEGINTIRLPINPPSVLQSWWPRYSALISHISAKGMKVILAYWESAASMDGKVDNDTAFQLMWNTVIKRYSNNGNVYFEVMNEPHGYQLNDLKTLYLSWLQKYNVPRYRVFLDGAGYATDPDAIGSDSRFDGCRLSFHFYAWFNGNYTTTMDWENAVANLQFPNRTVVTEFGVPMNNGKDYIAAPGTDKEIAYYQGMTNQIHTRAIGSIYWPGIRANDSYSMFSFDGNQLQKNNTSGFERLQYAWNLKDIVQPGGLFQETKDYVITNRNSNKSLDINGSSMLDGANVIQWDYWGGNNQLWNLHLTNGNIISIANKNSGKILSAQNASAESTIVQMGSNGKTDQTWIVTDIGFGYYKVVNQYGLSLDVSGGAGYNGAAIVQRYQSRTTTQQWKISLR